MKQIKDEVKSEIKGFVEIYKRSKNTKPSEEGKSEWGDWHKVCKKNLVVTNARQILRDLVYGQRETTSNGNTTWVDAPSIVALGLGDSNADNSTYEVQSATVDDLVLVNPTYWCYLTDEGTAVESTLYEGLPAIKYTFTLGQSQANTSSGFFNEFGLALDPNLYPDSYLFTRLVRTPAVVKTSNDEISIVYYLVF